MLRFVVKYRFHEKQFINQFLSAPVKSKLHSELQQNIHQVQNLNTLIGVIDTSYKQNQIIPLDLLKLVLQRSAELAQQENNLEYIKGLLLTLSINRIENRQLHQTILNQVMTNYHKFSDEHLITITETIVYNKLQLRYQIQDIQILYEQMAINLQKSDSQLYNSQTLTQLPKLINLTQHVRHNKLIHEILATIYGLLYQLKQCYNSELNPEFLGYSLQICHIMDTLEILFQNPQIVSSQKKQSKKLQEQFIDLINQSFTEKNLLGTQFSVNHINALLSYVKKYPKSPPLLIPKQILNLVGNIYISLVNEYTTKQSKKILKTLIDYNSLAYFLTKTSKSFNLADNDYSVIKSLVETENNLFILAKTLETISSNIQNHNDLYHGPQAQHHHHHEHPKLRDPVLQLIESKIKQLMQGHLNPSDSLVIAFQALIRIEDYQPKLATFLEYFSYGQVLNSLKWVDFIVKFIPSLGILSKRLTQQFYMQVQQNHDQFKQVSDVWQKVLTILIKRYDQIETNKIPLVLFYLSQASKLDIKQVSTLLHMFKKSLDFSKFNTQQICEIFYSFSRLNYQDTEFYYSLINKLSGKEFSMDQIILLYSGLLINKLYNASFIQQLQDQINIKELNEKNMLSYLQALITLQFQPKQQILDAIINQFFKTKNTEFMIGCSTSLLQYKFDEKIMAHYAQFIKGQQEIYIKSPFYAHQLHVLFMKLKHVDNVNEELLADIYKVLQESKISLAKYYLQMKQITKSELELTVVEQLNKFLDIQKLNSQSQLSEYKFTGSYDPIEIPKIDFLIPYEIDYRVGDYCFEINGPRHYLQVWPEKTYKLDGWTEKKKELLEKIGFKYIEVNHELYKQNGVEYLKQLSQI